MAIIRRNPLSNLTNWNAGSDLLSPFDSLQREMDRLFNRFRGGNNDLGMSTYVPPVDIIEEDNNFIVKAEIPGINKDDVKITVNNDVLTIQGEKRYEKEVNEKNFHRMETATGTFQRSFSLPYSVKTDNIEATYNNGVLTVILPKAEEAKPKQIDVKVK